MSQDEISKILKKTYPNYISIKKIRIKLGITESSINSNIRRMLKRNEIELEMKYDKRTARWIRKFREKD